MLVIIQEKEPYMVFDILVVSTNECSSFFHRSYVGYHTDVFDVFRRLLWTSGNQNDEKKKSTINCMADY